MVAYAAPMAEQNTQIRLASRPVGRPTAENFSVIREPVAEPGDGQVLTRTRYLSLDPYMRGRMSDARPTRRRFRSAGDGRRHRRRGRRVERPGLQAGDAVLGYGG